ncbi:MAG TPA: I78 family peptidase inhibitor [Ramlibacter sp.]
MLRPGMATTMEFNAERVNLEVDAANRVVKVRCG